jgi:hypothetical protein
VRLTFSAAIPWEEAQKIRLKGPDNKVYKARPDSPKGNESDESDESEYYTAPSDEQPKEIPEFVSSVVFKAPLPENSSMDCGIHHTAEQRRDDLPPIFRTPS